MATWRQTSQRSRTCMFCGMKDLHWYQDEDNTRRIALFGEDGISHNQRCPDRRGQRVLQGERVDLRDHRVIPAPKEHRNRGRNGRNRYDYDPRPQPQPFEPEPMPEDAIPVPDEVRDDSAVIAQLEAMNERLEALQRQVDEIPEPEIRVTVEDKPKQEVRDLGTCHAVMPEVLNDLLLGLNVWLVGPAGTGKTTIGKQCADGIGVPFAYKSITLRMPESVILGYMNATGQYVRTRFRDIWEHGGVFLFDECDAGDPNSLLAVNAALAGMPMAFPDGIINKHPNCYILAAANTYGIGADRHYVGRMQLDAAFLDRFGSYIEVDIDSGLENAAALARIADQDLGKRWIRLVETVRANAYRIKLPVVISPRASINGCILLNDGQAWGRVIEKALKKGLTAQDWSRITEDVDLTV